MRYSNTALKELSKRYKNILIKCAILNAAALLAFATPAMAADRYTIDTNQNLSNITLENYTSEGQIYGGVIGTGESLYPNTSVTIDTVVFKNNYSSYVAGAMSTGYDGTISIDDSEFVSNKALYDGGALGIFAPNVTVTRTLFQNNSTVASADNGSDGGGAVMIGGTANATFTDVQFIGNSSLARGGAVSIRTTGLETTFNNAKFASNTSGNFGGAIASVYKTTVSISDSSFTNNSAGKAGGAIYNGKDSNYGAGVDVAPTLSTNNGTINLSGTNTFTGNSASEKGGAIFNDAGGTLNLAGSNTFESNTAAGVKNDIHNEGTLNVAGTLVLDGGITGTEKSIINFNGATSLTARLNSSATILAGTIKGLSNVTITELIVEGGLESGSYALMSDGDASFKEINATNALYTFDQGTQHGEILITKKETSEVANTITTETGASQQEATAVLALVAADGSATGKGSLVAAAISEAMQSGNSATAVEAAKQAAPTTSQVVTGVAKEAANTIAKLSTSRLDSIKGTSGGDITQGAGLWMQALYNHTKQDATSNSDGFKANSRGFALGVDKEITDTTIVGVGYGYMYTDADSYGRDLEIDGHNFFIYGKYQPNKWYVSSVLNYNYSKYTEKKSPLGIQLRSEYDVNSYGANLMTGYDLKNGFTPEAGLRYLVVDADSYYDGMQRIHSNRDDVLTAVAGVKYTTTYKAKGIDFKPNVRLAATYDIVSDNSRSNVSVIGGSNYAVEGSRLHRFGVEAGAGVTASIDNIDITLEYNGAFRQDYKSQGGMLKARYNF